MPPAREAPPPTPAAVVPGEMPPSPRPVAVPKTPPPGWVGSSWSPDTDQRILALGSLIHTDSEKVIPILRDIALEEHNAGAARRAVWVLVQSRKPEAVSTIVEVAKRGREPVKVAAVRGLGSFGGPEVSQALLQLYSTGNAMVKREVVTTLGRAGGREQLASLYWKASREAKHPIIGGLFAARAEDELIGIAEKEGDKQLRTETLTRLRLLGTPKARAYLAKISP